MKLTSRLKLRTMPEGAWGRLNATERGQIMIRISEKVLENVEELSRLEVKDTGIARNDVTILARYFEFYGGQLLRRGWRG
jgi:aldehyde dehydrogenase (NAD+)